jgi:hypothetical protein
MKISSLIGIATFLVIAVFACGDNDTFDDTAYGYEEDFYNDYNSEDMETYGNEFGGNENASYQNNNQSNGAPVRFASNSAPSSGGIKMHPMKDANGTIIGHVPLPASWDITGAMWKGPGNTLVQYQQGGMFLDQQRRLSSIDQVIQQDVLPALQSQGGRAGSINNHPNIAAYNKRRDDAMVKYGQRQSQFTVKSVEFTDQQGMKGMIIVHFQRIFSQLGNMSGYYMQVMKCNANRFEQSKNELVYALANIQMNQQYVQAQNNAERQKLAANDASFQRRMAAKEQAFQNSQAQYRSYANDALDSGMDSWRRRNAMTDAGQTNAVNGIHGTRDVTNPYDGTTWNVDDGYNHTYMNTWGETIQTDDHFYDPNMDPNVNNQSWESVYEDY